MKQNIILWTLVAILSTVMSITFIKQFSDKHNSLWFVLSFVSYGFLVLSFSFLFASNDVAIVYPLVKASSIVLIVLLSILFNQEKIDTQSSIAIFMILIAIYLLSTKLSSPV